MGRINVVFGKQYSFSPHNMYLIISLVLYTLHWLENIAFIIIQSEQKSLVYLSKYYRGGVLYRANTLNTIHTGYY